MGKILIVDDSILMRRSIRTLIESETDHTIVAEAGNGLEACELFKQHQPDLVTMDINMPIMSGPEAVAEIRGESPTAKIVMISSVSERGMVLDALKAGACDFILKPITADKVLQVIVREIGPGTPPPTTDKKAVAASDALAQAANKDTSSASENIDPNKFL